MRWPSKPTTFWILMAVSALSAFVLHRWTVPARGLFQPLAVLQWPASWFSHKARQAVTGALEKPLSSNEGRALREEAARLEREVIHQRLALQAAEQRIQELTGLASQLPDSHAGIIVAPVVAADADPRRGSLVIAKVQESAAADWVRLGEWVVAGGADAQATEGDNRVRDLVWRGWLVGRVSEVQPQVARVQLTTDPRFATEVRVARLAADGALQIAEQACHLQGQGGGRMRITQAVEDYFHMDYRIVVVPAARDLPTTMTLGRVESSAPRQDSSQHFDLTVLPWGAAEKLTHVYVLVTEP